ncbi:MAG TPA: EF-hand domain-containing protein [Ensifer sp.]|nr:EF-hand domain-containing protein [Ensifer sp.]
MTSTSAVSGYGQGHHPSQKDMFNKMDTDKNGSVSKSEFVDARPKDMSEEQASKMFGKIDDKNTGSISFDQFSAAGAAGRASGKAMSGIMQLPQGGPDGKGPDAGKMFSKMDGDGDGKVTKSEFLSSRPDDASAEMATKMYNSIDTDGTGSFTESQFADAMKSRHQQG